MTNLKKSIDKINNIIENYNKNDEKLIDMILEIEPDKYGNYTFNEKQLNRFIELTNDVKDMAKEFDELKYIYPDLLKVKDKIKYLMDRNDDLIRENDKLIKQNQKYEKQHISDKNANDFLKSVIEKRHLDLVEHLVKGVASNDYYTSNTYKQVSKKFKEKGIISEAEHRVILRPLFGISRNEINQALHKINQEMENEVEYYRQQRVKEMSGTNENGYEL